MFPQYTETVAPSKPAPFVPTSPALLALVDRACDAYPDEQARILRGAEIVERDGVHVRADGMYEVGIYHCYPVNGHCPCPDSALGHAPGSRCKHAWGKTFYNTLKRQEPRVEETIRSLHFVASLCTSKPQKHGTATIYEDGRILFQEYDTDTHISCVYAEVVLGARINN